MDTHLAWKIRWKSDFLEVSCRTFGDFSQTESPDRDILAQYPDLPVMGIWPPDWDTVELVESLWKMLFLYIKARKNLKVCRCFAL
jgi:hypothetical protein